MILPIVITVLCAIGLYAAIFMFKKLQRAERGEVAGPSVVKMPQARLLGPPNTLFAIFYYPLLVLVVWGMYVFHVPFLFWAAFAGTLAAGLMSAALGFSLLFITKSWCPYCWLGHAVNWSLVALVWLLHVTGRMGA